MPIVSHDLKTTVQADGRISFVLRMYDQDAREYLQTGLAPAEFDMNGLVNLKKAEMDAGLAEQEFRTLVGL